MNSTRGRSRDGVESWGQVRVVRADDSYVEGTLVSHLDEVDSKRAVNAFSAVDEQHNSFGFDGFPRNEKARQSPEGEGGQEYSLLRASGRMIATPAHTL